MLLSVLGMSFLVLYSRKFFWEIHFLLVRQTETLDVFLSLFMIGFRESR